MSPPLRAALDFAESAHSGQLTKEGAPYVEHPLAIADVLAAHGADEQALVAALLHDTVERTDTTVADLSARFGSAIADSVAALSEDPSIADWVERKRGLRDQVSAAGVTEATVYAADKLVNVREMRRLYAAAGEGAVDLHKAPTLDVRVEAWWDDLDASEASGAPARLTHELRVELEGFAAERRAALAHG